MYQLSSLVFIQVPQTTSEGAISEPLACLPACMHVDSAPLCGQPSLASGREDVPNPTVTELAEGI